MAEAKRTTSIPGWETRRERIRERAAGVQVKEAFVTPFAGKTFEDLRPSEKDALLKAIAIHLNLIDPS